MGAVVSEFSHLLDDLVELSKRIPPTFRLSAQPSLERLRRHFEVQRALETDKARDASDANHAATNAASVDRAQLDLIRNMVDDMSGKPTKDEAIAVLAQIADLIGADAIG